MRLARVLVPLLAVVAWLALAPPSLGGSTSWVVTTGSSMAPRMATGDLVAVRERADYGVGDVVAYPSPLLSSVVLHRVVAVEGGTGGERLVLRGDANDWLDPERPTADEVIGAEWFHVPHGGVLLRLAGSPLAAGGLVLLLLGGGAAGGVRRRRARRQTARGTARTSRLPGGRTVTGRTAAGRMAAGRSGTGPAAGLAALPPRLQTAAACLAVAGLAGVVLGGLAWTRPAGVALGGPATTPQEMAFSYAATVPPSPAYDDTTVTEPAPVFRRLADTVDVTYRYDGRGAGTALAVAAELTTPDGWRSTVPLSPARALDGAAEHTGTVVLDLDALERRARDAADVTGSPPADVRVAVVPRVTTRSGAEFAPALELVLTPLQLRLADTETAGPDGATPLVVSGEVETGPGPVTAAQVGLLRWGLDVLPARLLAILLLAAAVVGGLEVRLRARRAAARPEPERLRDALGPLLVDVDAVEPPAGRPVVDVADPAVLARVAERYGLLVLHAERGGAAAGAGDHVYVVADEETWYRYTSPGTASAPSAPSAPPAPPVPRPRPRPAGRLRDVLPR